jgi:hypothetical protein
MPRSSFAIAMKDYTFIRPGIAVTVSAATLVVALIFGLDLIGSLKRAAATVDRGARATRSLHRYNAGLEVWRQMATSSDPAYRRPEALAQRDSIRGALREQLAALRTPIGTPADQDLVQTVLEGPAQRGVLLAAVLLALTIVAAGMLVVPRAWLYIRYKRGATIAVKV